ncbi:unnamed protein product [Ilex paraguariensis]|uniref:Enhanced disease susceptibility 1 n=1 Tax=Ilex paraguariensis TaxID=185542 RepID=A0ABC8R3S0_9AQUA
MEGGRLEDNIGVREELIKKACNLAMKAHKSAGKPYLFEKSRSPTEAIFGFAGSWSVGDWFSQKPFGEVQIDREIFPSVRSIGTDEVGLVNKAFYDRFEEIRTKSSLENEVDKAVSEKRQIVFAGHSSGGAIAILAALWFLEKYIRPNANNIPPKCVTFGSPLAGDRIFPHALRRENWARHFIHFIMRYDIVPRIMLAPLSSIEQELQPILDLFKPRSSSPFDHEFNSKINVASAFFVTVMRNASAISSHAACNLMGTTNLLLETVSSFVELSPYRPFGTYVFCTGNGKLVVVRNPDAVLQLLFYSAQLNSQTEGADVLHKSFKDHLIYEDELKESLDMQDVVYLEQLEDLPLSSDGSASVDVATTNTALKDLGLSTRARLCLRAAGEMEKQKLKNQAKINSNKDNIEKGLKMIQDYQTECEVRKVGYYDAFKLQKYENDFFANVKRVELVGIWDEIIEMLKRYELPDGFEGQKDWIELGTRFRRLLEPLDIANYYRHLKNEDTGPYMIRARPKRYRFTQRWREHAERMAVGSSFESCFLADVEELRTNPFEKVKEKIMSLDNQVYKWVCDGVLGKDVFLDESTFTKWWKTLPPQHRSASCISNYINS